VPRCSSPRHGLSCRFTLPRRTRLGLSASPASNGKDASDRLLQLHDFTTRAPARPVRLSRCRRTLFTLSFTSAGAKAPPDHSSGCAVDVALPASASSTTRPPSSDGGAGAGCSWWVSRSRKPSDGAPSRRRFQPRARRKNEPLTLPVAAPCGRSPTTPPGPLPPPLRQKRWIPRTEAPSLDELPARCLLSPTPRTRTRHRRRALPPDTGFRRSFAPRSEEEELDPAAFTSSSLASARRHTPLVDFCNRNDPQARPANRRNPPHDLAPPAFAGNADARNGSSAPFRATRPRCHGSGAGTDCGSRRGVLQLLSPRLRAPRAWPQPDWLGHLLSWTRDLAGRSGQLDRSSPPGEGSAFAGTFAPRTRFRAVPRRAASRTLPRRRMRSAAPEVPSVAEAPLRGGPLSPSCPQPVE